MFSYTKNGREIGQKYVIANVSKEDERISDYFSIEQRTPLSQVKDVLSKLSETITLIKHIEIYPQFRKKGHGEVLLKEIINESAGDVLLIAETTNDFLVDWYVRSGFEIIGYSSNLPILVFKK